MRAYSTGRFEEPATRKGYSLPQQETAVARYLCIAPSNEGTPAHRVDCQRIATLFGHGEESAPDAHAAYGPLARARAAWRFARETVSDAATLLRHEAEARRG